MDAHTDNAWTRSYRRALILRDEKRRHKIMRNLVIACAGIAIACIFAIIVIGMVMR